MEPEELVVLAESVRGCSFADGQRSQLLVALNSLVSRYTNGDRKGAFPEQLQSALVSRVAHELLLGREYDSAKHLLAELGRTIDPDTRNEVTKSEEVLRSTRLCFLCSAHKSGSTLLAEALVDVYALSSLIGGIPENEGQFLQNVFQSERSFGGPGRSFLSLPLVERRQFNLPAAGLRELSIKLQSQWASHELFRSDTLLEKSPTNLVRIDVLRKMFPGSSFLVLTRDPRCVAMASSAWRNDTIPEILHNLHVGYLKAFMDLEDDCHVVRYEDFCDRPADILKEIGQFLKLDRSAIESVPERLQSFPTAIESTNQQYLDRWEAQIIQYYNPFRGWELFGYSHI